MAKRDIQFLGRIYPSGKGTLTVSHNDIFAVREIQKSVTDMRKQFNRSEKGREIGSQEYRQNHDTHFYMSKLTPEQFSEIKPFLETNAEYHAVERNGRIAFAVDKENASNFHRAFENGVREVGMLKNMAELNLTTEQNIALSPVIHRLVVEDVQLNLAEFFDKNYDESQFDEMLSLVNDYLGQSPAERYGEHSKLNEMLEAKNSFDQIIELSDFFSKHNFSDEQRAAITDMFVGDVTKGQIENIDETFTVEDIQTYDEILHNALQESDVAEFLTAHRQNKEPTEEEILFGKADLADFIARHILSADEWEDMAYPLFENGYTENHKPSEKAIFSYRMPEKELFALAEKYHNGEDISHNLAVGLLQHGNDNIDFVFEGENISDCTYYYAENLRHSLNLERTEDGYHCSFGDMERFVSFEEIGQAFIDITHEEFDNLMYWRILDYIKDDIPDISGETVQQLIKAFDGYKGNINENQTEIKQNLNDILHDSERAEKAFSCIAKHKYNFEMAENKLENRLFSIEQNGEIRYYKTAETADIVIETAKNSKHAFIDLDKIGSRITEAEFAETEQSDRVNYSAEFNLDSKNVQVREINGIAESARNSENISVKTISLEQLENSLHFGFLGNGITAYDTSRTDPETHDFPIVAHISDEGVVKIYDENISAEDMERVNSEAKSDHEKFMTNWNMLSTEQQFQRLLDRADIATMTNINRENIPMEQKIEKYMPFVFFSEGECPEPEQQTAEMVYTVDDVENAEPPAVADFRAKTEENFRFYNFKPVEVENIVKDFVHRVFEENGVTAEIGSAAVTSSRSCGLENADSDIDVVIEIDSDLKEDALFNIIHDEELTLEGYKIENLST